MNTRIELLPIELLDNNNGQVAGVPKNPRQIKRDQFNRLVESLRQSDLTECKPLLVYQQGERYVVLGGNMRLRALKQLKAQQVPCIIVPQDYTIEQLKKLVIIDNSEFGEYDWDMLANEWSEEPLKEWGVEIENWEGDKKTAKEDDFDETKIDIPRQVQAGDVWQLGKHRLMCGDSTNADDVAKLMNGELADISFSSPPYNAGFGKNISKSKSKYLHAEDNKTQEQYTKFITQYIACAMGASKYTFCNIQWLKNNYQSIIDLLVTYRNKIADIIIWDKTRAQPNIANNVLNSQFEFVFCFSQKGNRNIGTIPFHGTLKNIVTIAPGHNDYSAIHNAVFPIELAGYFIDNFAKDSVLDLFGGSGTTIVAAEQLGRKCYMMELDPYYCDVIIARWEKLTGEKAIKVS